MTLSWALEGESTPFTVAVLKSLQEVQAVVPALWPFEVANVLRTAERRVRVDAAAQAGFLERLRLLPIWSSTVPLPGLDSRFFHWLGRIS